ncbi:MAG: protein phosphatase 2C domain-containing protein [Patescibacteria group bacterium]
MSTTKTFLESHLPFTFAHASVTGRDHIRSGKNNHDGFCVIHQHNATIAVVTDGCGSGSQHENTTNHNEIGAVLGARLVCSEVLRALNNYAPESQHLLFDHQNHWEWREGIPGRVCVKLSALITSMEVEDRAIFVQDHLLFTIVGVLMTATHAAFFSLGDGAMVINGEHLPLEIAEANSPPYLAYRLVKTSLPPQSLILTVNRVIATNDLHHFLLATDGIAHLQRHESDMLPGTDSPIGPVSQFWTEERYVMNRDALRRRLSAIATDVVRMNNLGTAIARNPGLLPDDTTVILGKRNEVCEQ